MKLFLISFLLTGCDWRNSSEKSPDLIANTDIIEETWVNNLEIDVLGNDVYTGSVEIVIQNQTEYGSLEVKDNRVIYNVNTTNLKTDSFSYYLKQGRQTSAIANVTIELSNQVSNILLPQVNFLEEGNTYSVEVELFQPLFEDQNIILERMINGEVDHTFGTKKFFLQKGEDKLSISYEHYVDELPGDYRQEHTLIAYLEVNEKNKIEKKYDSIGTPNPDSLHQSIKTIWYNSKDYKSIVERRAFGLSWMNYPVWTIPDEPTWTENPYNNNSWLLYYHSLTWLYAYEYAYEVSGNVEYIEVIEKTLLNYLASSPQSSPKNPMSWNDHTVALRTDNLVYLYTKFFKKTWDDDTKSLFLSGVKEHAAELRKLLDDKRYFAHNHSMFHALSLYNYSFALPVESMNFDYRERAKQRMKELHEEMVDGESGISVEQSSAYHVGAIKLFATSNDLMSNLSGVYDEELKEGISKMVDFAAHLLYPNGGAPTMGDSNYGDITYLTRLNEAIENKGIESSFLDFVNSGGVEGESLQTILASTSSGYVLLRPEIDYNWHDQTVLFFDAGKKKHSHGHYDALNFTLFNDGESLLVDSGGPFIYTSAYRAHFRSKYAHNALIIDGVEEDINDSVLHDTECLPSICYTAGQITQRGTTHSRVIIATRDSKPMTYIFDHVRSSELHNFELLYHFPVDSVIANHSSFDRVRLSSGTSFDVTVISSSDLHKNYYHGDGSVELQNKRGWVSPKYALELPAPVLEYSNYSKNYWSLTEINQTGTVSNFNIIKSSGSESFTIVAADFSISIDLTNVDTPIIQLID
ncbi:heparinase II/III domain-containing protein [Litorilituus lipolyticus]|uniref:heparinase II/III domain-containing protein n=1 Tax=Litorilituus lipolyticus TaxID=2491017 RepID=UPI0014783EC6|nr:heparinase II/III family protein [Litorilituus lipolyticus]